MNKVANKLLPKIGVDMFHYALLLNDEPGSVPQFSPPVAVPSVTQVGFNPNAQTASFYADNSVYATATQTGDLVVTVGLADITNEIRGEWLGQAYEDGVLQEGQIDPKDIAIGFRRKKSDGSYAYIWHYKGKASPPSETTDTQGSSINFQSDSISITCSTLLSTGKHRKIIEDNDVNLPTGVTAKDIEDNFFTDVLWMPEEDA